MKVKRTYVYTLSCLSTHSYVLVGAHSGTFIKQYKCTEGLSQTKKGPPWRSTLKAILLQSVCQVGEYVSVIFEYTGLYTLTIAHHTILPGIVA